MQYIRLIGFTHMRIADGLDTLLQLQGLVARTENQSDSSSPSHSAMNAAFHSALVGRVTRTHQGGKNMGARAMSKIFRKHLMKERWNHEMYR